MLEAIAHKNLKQLLLNIPDTWPHNLTLSRLVARSIRRRDTALMQLDVDGQDSWWIGLLLPLCLEHSNVALVLSPRQLRRLLNHELPRLKEAGFKLPCWEGAQPPPNGQLWLIDHVGLIPGLYDGRFCSKQLIFPEAELISEAFREAMAIQITAENWEQLARAHPSAELALLNLYERISRRIFSQAASSNALVRLDGSEIITLRDLIGILEPSPSPWPSLLKASGQEWASWAELDHKTLNWKWNLKPLEPLHLLEEFLIQKPSIFLTTLGSDSHMVNTLRELHFPINVEVKLGESNFKEPLSLYAPNQQPLPNTQTFSDYLLDQSRRLILGRSGITILLLDDCQLRTQLTSQLAAEFGKRVVHETTNPDLNGVICCRWSWWIDHQAHLPAPEQVIVALLPLASLSSPLIAARVEALKLQGRDWFRELLLPEALTLMPKAVAPMRVNSGRIAILDGRLRSRTWGKEFLRTLEPWTPLLHLLPD